MCVCRVKWEAGCADGKDAPLVYWTGRAVGARKTFLPKLKDFAFFRDQRQEGPRHLSGGLSVQKLNVRHLETACLVMGVL